MTTKNDISLPNGRNKLLSIAIPTYNRSAYLDLCLSQICKQLPGNEAYIELIVSDNASPDDTESIVKKYIAADFSINYVRNPENIGADGNVAQAFRVATSKYVLILADDDVLVDGSIKKILDILHSGDYGVVHLQAYPYQTDFANEFPKKNKRAEAVVYDDLKRFIKRVNYYFTFISGNVVNKSLVDENIKTKNFNGTGMNHLSWIFTVLFKSCKNVYIGTYMVAAKGGNTGGYQVCRVFGENVNKVFNYFVATGVQRKYFKIINRNLVFSFFPVLIRNLRKDRGKFHEERYFDVLFPVFRRYLGFWVFTVPAIYFPLPIVRLWISVIRELMNISKRYGKLIDKIFGRELM